MWFAFVLSIIVLITSYPYCRRQTKIKQWCKKLSIPQHQANFQQLYSGIDGFATSRQARSEHDAIEYTYGEIDFRSFIALLSLAKPDGNTIFYDFGSGTGKAVLACAMVFKVSSSIGIELFQPLHTTALEVNNRLKRLPGYVEIANKLRFVNANFLDTDFNDATLIFINATAFFGETWHAINQCLVQVKPGTTVITTSKRLSGNAFALIKATTVQMSWGVVSAYIQKRVA